MEGPGLEFSEAVIDNGKYGRHTIRFESGVLAQQADGSAAVYLDGDTMLLAATTAAKAPRDASPAPSSAARDAPARVPSSPHA